MRRPGQRADTRAQAGQPGRIKERHETVCLGPAWPVTIEPYEWPDTAVGSRHTRSRGPGGPGPPDCRGRIRGRQGAEGMNQRVPAVSGQYGVTAGGCHWWRHWRPGGSGGGEQTQTAQRTGQGSLLCHLRGCHRPRRGDGGQASCAASCHPSPEAVLPGPASPGLARKPRSVRG